VGSDAAAGAGLSLLLAGRGLVVCWWIAAGGGMMALTDSCGTGARSPRVSGHAAGRFGCAGVVCRGVRETWSWWEVSLHVSAQ